VIVYDFGCVKQVPERLSAGYGRLMLAVIEDRHDDIPDILLRMGISKGGGRTIPAEITDAYATVLGRIAREDPPYTFGADDLVDELMRLGRTYWSEATDMQAPGDLIFVNRTFAGHVANLGRLRATGRWRDMIRRYAEMGRSLPLPAP
jgi:predicted unusual protein kinase regulating ubiquinone biosynthesis (AarF/ABC1/UbiB family)